MAGSNIDTTSRNPLVLTNKARDTPLTVSLHPLVLLTISDYITRHTLRSQHGPIVGAILGQQTGRSTTLEHAYECKTLPLTSNDSDAGGLLDEAWFTERLEQYRDVHKAPALDLVGMFMLGPVEGPQAAQLPVLKQVRQLTGDAEGGLVLLFHAEMVEGLRGGRLPITLYEGLSGGGEMRFRELGFEVETGEAEMIGVDFVAKGGGNAMAVQKVEVSQAAAGAGGKGKGKGKNKAKEKEKEEAETNGEGSVAALSPEDEELIASLNAKANAIKMLDQRLNVIRTYLAELPPSYLTDAASTTPTPATTQYPLLRSISAMLSRLPLLAPPQPVAQPTTVASPTTSTTAAPSTSNPLLSSSHPTTSLQTASSLERADVHLTSLLAALTRVTAEAQSMGGKFHVFSREKVGKDRGPPPFGGPGRGNRFGGVEEDDEGRAVLG